MKPIKINTNVRHGHICETCACPHYTDEQLKKMEISDKNEDAYAKKHLLKHPHGTPKHRINPMCDECWANW